MASFVWVPSDGADLQPNTSHGARLATEDSESEGLPNVSRLDSIDRHHKFHTILMTTEFQAEEKLGSGFGGLNRASLGLLRHPGGNPANDRSRGWIAQVSVEPRIRNFATAYALLARRPRRSKCFSLPAVFGCGQSSRSSSGSRSPFGPPVSLAVKGTASSATSSSASSSSQLR